MDAMAERVAGAEKRPAIVASGCSESEEEELKRKRLKQGRLPFKPLDCKSQVSVHAASKKRKLSGQESPNSKAKQPKLPDVRTSSGKLKPSQVVDDNEVSSTSSSEAEQVPPSGSKSKAAKSNILEKFVRREDEISSTNEVIDLTEIELDENSPMKVRSPHKSGNKSPTKKTQPKEKIEDHFSRRLEFGDKKATEATEAASPKEQESKENDTAESDVECLDDACEGDGQGSGPATAAEETDNQANNSIADMDKSLNTSTADAVITETSTPQKEGGERPSSKKEAGETLPPSLTSTPQTPASANTSCSSADGATPASDKKKKRSLSKKQLERSAQRQKVKEEKDRQKLEAKEQKEKERLEKKQKRDEEKAEKERAKKEEKEKKEKERLEKKEQAEKEKQEKQQQKEEEKQKKQEIVAAKLEEKKKKDEEKKQKEEQKQKEEEEKLRQAQKRKAAFTSFFIKPKAVTSTKVTKAADNLFIPFEVKKDMTLAPVRRQDLSQVDRQHLDVAMESQKGDVTYLHQLKQGTKKPVRTNRVLRKKKEVEQEVELLVHDSETVKKVTHAVKVLQFHTDYRPPYFGTWRKQPKGLSPRNPWKKDEAVFDYEVDSDEEWEEEEPGESLSDSNGEEEEGEDEDDGDDDGWMVPHGYLSEDEGCEDDEEVTPEVLKARQRAKAQAWEAELKAKKQVLPPTHLGCFWLDCPCTVTEHLKILKDFEMVCLRASPVDTLISCPRQTDGQADNSVDRPSGRTSPKNKGCRKRALPEEAMPDLIRLVHGNSVGIKKLVREFRLYWRQQTTDLNVSVSEDANKTLNNSDMDTSTAPKDSSKTQDAGREANTTEDVQSSPVKMDVDEEDVKLDDSAVSEGTDKKQDQSVVGDDEDKKLDDSTMGEEVGDSCVSKRQLEMKIMAIAVREKRECNKKRCWYVNDDVLKQYNLVDLPAENSWVYVSGDMNKKTPSKAGDKKTPNKPVDKKTPKRSSEKKTPNKPAEKKGAQNSEETIQGEDDKKTPLKSSITGNADVTPKSAKVKKTPKDQPSIMAFAKKTPTTQMKEKTPKAQSANTDDKESQPKSGNQHADVIDVDMETDQADTKTVQEGQNDMDKSEKETVESVNMEEDCIVLD